MIFKFDESLIDSKSEYELAKLLLEAVKKEQKIDCSEKFWKYVETSVLVTQNVGTRDIEKIKSFYELRDIKTVWREYLTTLVVGNGEDMISIECAMDIVKKKSCVVLENGSYDWPTVMKWIEYFDKQIQTNYTTINKMVHKAVDNKWLIQEHAGGGGGAIVNRIECLSKNSYGGIETYKLSTIFDSDKSSANDVNRKNDSLKKYLQEHKILGHELCKREIENYYSWETYFDAQKAKSQNPPTTDSLEYDYLDIAECPNIKLKKSDMAIMAGYMKPDRLRQRLQSNMVENNGEYEVQKIILMLARII